MVPVPVATYVDVPTQTTEGTVETGPTKRAPALVVFAQSGHRGWPGMVFAQSGNQGLPGAWFSPSPDIKAVRALGEYPASFVVGVSMHRELAAFLHDQPCNPA